MSQYNITLVISGWVKVEPAKEQVADGLVFQVDIQGEPKLVLNGTELTSPEESEKYGTDGARAAILALLEATYKKVQMGKQEADVTAPTQPGASA